MRVQFPLIKYWNSSIVSIAHQLCYPCATSSYVRGAQLDHKVSNWGTPWEYTTGKENSKEQPDQLLISVMYFFISGKPLWRNCVTGIYCSLISQHLCWTTCRYYNKCRTWSTVKQNPILLLRGNLFGKRKPLLAFYNFEQFYFNFFNVKTNLLLGLTR